MNRNARRSFASQSSLAIMYALTVVALILQGLFFAASPTAGEGFTAQRFMAAKNEFHAQVGQLVNSVFSLVWPVCVIHSRGYDVKDQETLGRQGWMFLAPSEKRNSGAISTR